MMQIQDSGPKNRRNAFSRNLGLLLAGLILLPAGAASAAQAAGGPEPMKPLSVQQIFLFFFLLLGPIKIIGPFARMTQGADTWLAHRIAGRAILFSIVALLLAGLVGESTLERYSMPLPVLALAGGVVLFLVALQSVLQQFTPPAPGRGEAPPATLSMAITPIAFPTIVTPYGIAALIIFIALSPDWRGRLVVGGILLVIMLLNLVAMLLARHILRFLGVFLQILGAVLGIIQVALGLQIILNSLQRLWV
jgi:multiple antibiotic resistance protein